MSTPQHPGFSNPSQQSGMSLVRLGLVIFIATFLAIIASCYAISKYMYPDDHEGATRLREQRGL